MACGAAAGNDLRVTGSHILAPQGDIDIAAKSIAITEARETSKSVTETRFKQSGLTIAISNPVVNAVQTAQQMHKATGQVQDGRLKALAAANTALSAKNQKGSVIHGTTLSLSGS